MPKCPNHQVDLTQCGFPIPPKGQGVCPVSGASFSFEVEIDETKMQVDKEGNVTKGTKFKITGDD